MSTVLLFARLYPSSSLAVPFFSRFLFLFVFFFSLLLVKGCCCALPFLVKRSILGPQDWETKWWPNLKLYSEIFVSTHSLSSVNRTISVWCRAKGRRSERRVLKVTLKLGTWPRTQLCRQPLIWGPFIWEKCKFTGIFEHWNKVNSII